MKLGVCDIRPGPSPFPRGSEKLVPSSADMDAAGFVMKPSEASAVPMRSPSPGGEGKRQSNWPLRIPVAAGLLILLFALLCITPPVLAQTNLIVIGQSANPPTVGMEGQLDVALPLTGLITKPGDHRAPLVLRIADTQPHGTFTRYDLRYVGRVPGPHDLRDYLFTAEGELATNLPALKVTVHGLLPKPHSGWLEEEAHHAPTLFSGYRGILIVIGALWVVAFFVIRRIDRKPKPATPAAETTAEPTFAERLRPLVERAAAGQLTAAEKATEFDQRRGRFDSATAPTC